MLRWEGKDAEGSGRQSGGKGKGKGKATHDERAEEAKRVPVGDMLPIGFDMSSGLLGIAKGKGHEVVRGDCVDLRCWRRGAFVSASLSSLSTASSSKLRAGPRHLDCDNPPLCDSRAAD